jgi:ATP-binding cassette subfamily B protein
MAGKHEDLPATILFLPVFCKRFRPTSLEKTGASMSQRPILTTSPVSTAEPFGEQQAAAAPSEHLVPDEIMADGQLPTEPEIEPEIAFQKMNARPYLGRATKLLGSHKAIVGASVLLSLIITLLPFVAAIAFGSLVKTLGDAFTRYGNASLVWTLPGSFFPKADAGAGWLAHSFPQLNNWLSTPVSFLTIFITWVVAIAGIHLLLLLRAWVDAHLEQRLLMKLRQDAYDHLQSLSLDFFTSGQTGALMQRVTSETGGVQRFLTQVLLTPLIDIVVLILALGYLFALSWEMTLWAFALAPLTLLMIRYTGGKMQQAMMGMILGGREMSSELQETISGISDIQVFNAQKKRSERFRVAARAAARSGVKGMAWMGLGNSGAQVFISLSIALLLLVATLRGGKLPLDLAGILIFMQATQNMFVPIERLIGAYTTYQAVVPNIVSTYELLDTKPTVIEKPGARSLGEVHGDITFENVSFGYSPTQKVLDGISFHIKEGETVALVGPIGCGKSTVMNLMLRFLDPESGRILLEGQDISEVTLNSLREQVSKLSQFPFFLKDSISENVRLGRNEATDAEIEEACKLAHIHDVIIDPQCIPEGYETVVDVSVPSGGQKRLIALARCLLRRPEVLLLDEPTENLDADQRNRLIQVIREYAKERTCLVISHDLNFVAAVSDRILVLNQGRVMDEGTHDDLIGREGLYKRLYELKNTDPALLRTRETPVV